MTSLDCGINSMYHGSPKGKSRFSAGETVLEECIYQVFEPGKTGIYWR